jgi:hypothetical protein
MRAVNFSHQTALAESSSKVWKLEACDYEFFLSEAKVGGRNGGGKKWM